MSVLNRRAVIGVIERCVLCLVSLSTCSVGQAALLKNFAGSYALYQQCTTPAPDFDSDHDVDGLDFLMWQRGRGQAGQFITSYGDADRNGFVNHVDFGSWQGQFGGIVPLSNSLCFKLYFDPEGIVSGSVTLVLDVPNPQPGQTRLDLGGMTGLVDLHPGYTATVQQATVLSPPGRQIIEARVAFQAANALNPPAGPVTIFGFQADDNQPQLGPGGVQARFEFREGDFISLFNPENNQTTTFNNSELPPQPVSLVVPLILDVNTLNGAVSIRNASSVPANINYYEITSYGGGLDAVGWTSIDDTEGGDPPGIGWDEAGGAGATALAESNFVGTLPLNTLQSHSLGHAFNEIAGVRDLRFFYSTPQGALIPGEINYNTTSLAGAVPEPSSMALAGGALAILASRRRRRATFADERRLLALPKTERVWNPMTIRPSRKLLAALAALSLSLLGIVDARAQNLVVNPGFEDPTSTTTPVGNWFRFSSPPNGTSEDSTAMPRSGAGHVDLTIVGANQFAGLFQTLPVPISPGQTLRFNGWHKSVDNPFNATVEIKIEWTGAPQNKIDLLTLGQNYEPFSHLAVAPAGTTGANVTYAISTFGAGQGDSRVFIDDFSASIVALLGDFDHDNDVDVTDYLTLSTNLFTDVSGLTPEQAYLQGDMTSDRLINGNDLRSFRIAFDDANGEAAFAAMLATVPEPAAGALAAVGAATALLARRRALAAVARRKKKPWACPQG